jgi:hypothetical protein
MNLWIKCRGKPSRTLTMVVVSFVAMTGKFIVAGLSVKGLTFPPMTVGEYGLAIAPIIGIWATRDHYAKKQEIEHE